MTSSYCDPPLNHSCCRKAAGWTSPELTQVSDRGEPQPTPCEDDGITESPRGWASHHYCRRHKSLLRILRQHESITIKLPACGPPQSPQTAPFTEGIQLAVTGIELGVHQLQLIISARRRVNGRLSVMPRDTYGWLRVTSNARSITL